MKRPSVPFLYSPRRADTIFTDATTAKQSRDGRVSYKGALACTSLIIPPLSRLWKTRWHLSWEIPFWTSSSPYTRTMPRALLPCCPTATIHKRFLVVAMPKTVSVARRSAQPVFPLMFHTQSKLRFLPIQSFKLPIYHRAFLPTWPTAPSPPTRHSGPSPFRSDCRPLHPMSFCGLSICPFPIDCWDKCTSRYCEYCSRNCKWDTTGKTAAAAAVIHRPSMSSRSANATVCGGRSGRETI